MPDGLQLALAGLKDLLAPSVNASYPALSGKPQAAMLRLDYRGQELVSYALGDKDPKSRLGPPDATTIFRIGSVSKLFPVLMLYQLLDRGVVASLDDPLSKYAPDFELPNTYSSAKRKFTLRQLASQMSGLPRELPCNMVDCHLTTQEVLERYRKLPGAMYPEYTEPSYSNAAYALLGNVLAEYINTTFEEYVHTNILEPLGMHDTGFRIDDKVEARMAKNYINETLTKNFDIGYNAPAGQMYSTINDLMILGRYYLGLSGSLFDDGLRRELLTPGFVFRDGKFLQGAPWEAQLLEGGWLMLGKGGNVWGFSSVLGIIPTLNLTFAAVWSGNFDETTFVAQAFEKVLPELVPAITSRRPPPRLPTEPERYMGRYSATVPSLSEAPIVLAIDLAAVPQGGKALRVSSATSNGWLEFHNDDLADVSVNGADSPTTCFGVMAGASAHDWYVFNRDANGDVVSLEVPGSLYGVQFMRESSLFGPSMVEEAYVI